MIVLKMSGMLWHLEIGVDKSKNNKFMPLRIDDDKPLEKYKSIWTKIEHLKNIELYNLLVYDDICIKIKIKAYGEILYINFCGLNVPEDGLKHESVTGISFNFLLVYENKYYLQVHLENCAYKIVDK